MNKNNPVRLHKKEPLTLEYEVATVYLIWALTIVVIFILAMILGSDNFNYLLWNCI